MASLLNKTFVDCAIVWIPPVPTMLLDVNQLSEWKEIVRFGIMLCEAHGFKLFCKEEEWVDSYTNLYFVHNDKQTYFSPNGIRFS